MNSTRMYFRLYTMFFVAILSFTLPTRAQQPTGTLKGKVVTTLGEPVVNANVYMKELELGDATSENGTYTIRRIPPGTYTVTVSSLGFASVSRRIDVKQEQTLTEDFTLSEQAIDFPAIVVTGTRSERVITNVPIPTSVITEKQIAAQSAVRLNDLLSEQNGMFIQYNQFGTGIQVEGLDPAYTLILLDGEPVIGRTAGTLDITRLTLGNIQRVEVVKGPSSSLYGSEALAAVVNLITKQPSHPLKLSLKTRYGSHNTLDANAGVELAQGIVGVSVFVERNSSDGYDLSPESASQTAPRYTNYSVNPKLHLNLGENTNAVVSGRLVTQNHSNTADVTVEGLSMTMDERSALLDGSVASTLTHRFSPAFRLEARLYRANYENDYQVLYQTSGATFDQSTFYQTFNKAETQLDYTFSKQLLSTFGAGYIYETVQADRISGDGHTTASSFVFAQQEWIPEEYLDLIASFRYDAHSDYASRLSPKLSALVKPLPWLSLRSSVGSGFKAPTFQQLYLDFTNSQVGYSVYGSTTAAEGFRQLQATGQVESVLLDPATLERIKPEHSLAFSAGVDIHLMDDMTARVNGFQNELQDLIEAAPFAMKTNGQAIFTYFNIHKVFTRGFDAEVVLKPFKPLTISFSYQYVEAKDKDVLEDVRAGKIFKIGSTGRARPVQEAEYGGLFNRSAHSGTIKLSYENDDMGFRANLRGLFRSRVGFADLNGNTILDDDKEYAPGYILWNLTVSKTVTTNFILQAGVDNIFDTTAPVFFPSLPGRILFARFSYEYN